MPAPRHHEGVEGKGDSDGRVLGPKARLCARGFGQRAGVDFFEAFSPCPNVSSIRLLAAIACSTLASANRVQSPDRQRLENDAPELQEWTACKTYNVQKPCVMHEDHGSLQIVEALSGPETNTCQ